MNNTPHICDSPNCSHSSHTPIYKPLVNCHMHSSGSTDGCSHIKDYVKLAKEFNIPALALTDHGNAHMLFDFYKTVKEAGLKPILGEEFYLCADLTLKAPSRDRELINRDKHQTVLIKDAEGYKNFCKLNYLSFTEGYYYKPRIDFEMLFAHSKGLIITSGCAASIFNQFVMNGKEKEAEEWFVRFVKTFGQDFYGEIQFNELNDMAKYGMSQQLGNDFIIRMCNKYDIKVVIGGDSHYANEEDNKLQDIILKAWSNKTSDESFIHARHLYFHNSEHYQKFNKEFGFNYDFKFIDECLENSIKLADKVNFEFDTKTDNYPKFNLPAKKTTEKYLEELAYEGLLKKLDERRSLGEVFSDELIVKYEERLDLELKVINDKKYGDYFLISQDLLRWAKDNDILTGISRGSVGGSLLAYSLGIIGIDPLKFGLYFERFINPTRSAKPDIDSDFERGSREKVREYLELKYGKDSVFGVSTYQTYQSNGALSDVSRGLGKDTSFNSPLREVLALKGLNDEDDLIAFFDKTKDSPSCTPTLLNWILTNQDTIKWAQKLKGQFKNLGTHAGGLVIAPGPIYNYIPVAKGGGEIVTAFREADGSVKDLSELGLLKLDILGLKTLNVIKGCINDIKKDLGIDLSLRILNLDLEDPKLYEKFNKGNNVGIFQLEGSAQDFLIKSIQPDCFDDIVAITAINRPGPLESFAPVFGKWKRWEKENNTKELEAIDSQRYPFEFMRPVLKRTYGTLLFQEQFMLMVVAAAGFTMGEADSFRRAISWRKDHPKYYTVKKYFDQLEKGMLEKGYSSNDVEMFLDYCREFMGYSFNLSHSVGYTYIGMQTLFLKVYYPAYFYTHLLNAEDNNERYQNIIADAVANGIKVLSPSITKSKHKFTVENNSIRIGFVALKGFGDKAMEELEALGLSKCETIYEVLSKPFKKVNSAAFQALIDSGAFDEFEVEREKIEIIKSLYKDTKIEKWFTRKSKALTVEKMPPSLLEFPEVIVMSLVSELKDEPDHWKKLISQLIPYIKVKLLKEEAKDLREEEVLGFSFRTINKLSLLLSLSDKHPELKLQSLSTREKDDDLCYWFCLKRTVAKTKRGKSYLVLDISDNSIMIKAKCWDMVDIYKGKAYVSHLKKDQFGYTITNDGLITEIDL